MGENREFEGKDLEEALQAASRNLGISEDRIHYRLLDEGRRGVFGLGARSVRILVEPTPLSDDTAGEPREEDPPPTVSQASELIAPAETARTSERKKSGRQGRDNRENRSTRGQRGGRSGHGERGNRNRKRSRRRHDERSRQPSAQPAKPVEVDANQMTDLAEKVDRMFELMDLELSAEAEVTRGGVRLQLGGEDRKVLLQKDADFLNAMQFLLNRMSRRAWPGVGRIQLVCEGHRNRRDDDLIEEVREVAGQVSRTGEPKRLHSMNPYERRLVHLTIREFPDLTTRSEGDGFMKTITVSRTESE